MPRSPSNRTPTFSARHAWRLQQRNATAGGTRVTTANSSPMNDGAQRRPTIGSANSNQRYTYGAGSSGGITPRQSTCIGGGETQRTNQQHDEQQQQSAPAVKKKVLPLQNDLLMRIIRRGGMWGVRALRLALGKQLQQYHHHVRIASAPSNAASPSSDVYETQKSA